MKKKSYKLFAATLFVSLLLIFVGCTQQTGVNTENEDLESVEAVLQNALTGPSDELKELLDSKGVEGLADYEEELYKEHFADDTSYIEFVSRYGSTLMIDPLRNGYNLKVKDIEFEKTDSEEIIFNFSVELEYQKEGSELIETGMIEGQANLNEDHKIEVMMIRTDLWKKFSE